MSAQLLMARIVIDYVHARAELARRAGRNQIGASAIEWAVISGIVVVLAVGIAAAITKVVTSRENDISTGN